MEEKSHWELNFRLPPCLALQMQNPVNRVHFRSCPNPGLDVLRGLLRGL